MLDNGMATLLMLHRRWRGMGAPTLELQVRYHGPLLPPPAEAVAVTRFFYMSAEVVHVESLIYQGGRLVASGASSLMMTYTSTRHKPKRSAL
jgi:hypothetical protein